jgi:histidinol-phosphatase (PHP family)
MFFLPADYHIHTLFSGDSDASLDKIASFALSNGLHSICITDHLDFDYTDGDISFELPLDEYFYSIKEFQERYKDTLDIRIGIETGLEPDKALRLDNFISRHNYDFIIGSSHLINGFDPYYPEYFKNKSDKEAFEEYFLSILKNLEYCNNFDVYGHIDYVVRYSPNKDNNYNYLDYFDIIDEILKKLINSNKGIEINTSGLRAGLKNPNPCYNIIKRYKELGGTIITFGSDAHYPEHIAYEFKSVKEQIQAYGFKYYTEFKNRIPEFIKIKD